MSVHSPAMASDITSAHPLLIIPAHNEARNIGQVLSEVKVTGVSLDILVVDDCSSDETARVARGQGARVLRLPTNLGYGGAVQAGFRYATRHGYAEVVMMDADGQHDASCIAALLHPVQQGEADVVLGSRFLGRMEYETTFAKRAGMAIFSKLVTSLTGTTITDPTSGFQALNRGVPSIVGAMASPVNRSNSAANEHGPSRQGTLNACGANPAPASLVTPKATRRPDGRTRRPCSVGHRTSVGGRRSCQY